MTDMDLYLCPSCNRRFVTTVIHPTAIRRCRACGTPLQLKVRSIPGKNDLVAGALHAELLDEARVGHLPSQGSGH